MKLPHFVKQDQYISKSLKEDSLKRSKEHFSSIISPENVTECLRRMYFRIKAKDHTNENWFAESAHKHCVSNKWAYYFSKCKKIILIDSNIQVAHSSYNIGGIIDSYIEFDDCRYIVKLKPVTEEEFQIIKEKGPKRKHVIETIVYLWLAEFEDGLLIYENNDNQESIVYQVVPYAPALRAVQDKCRELMEYQMRGIAPKKISGGNAKKECEKCEYKNVC